MPTSVGPVAVRYDLAVETKQVDVRAQFVTSQSPPVQASSEGLKVLSRIASSTRLSADEKRQLMRLVALVDETSPAGSPDHTRMMGYVAAIASVREVMADQSTRPAQPATPLDEAISFYAAERRRLGQQKGTTTVTDVEVSIGEVSLKMTGKGLVREGSEADPDRADVLGLRTKPVVDLVA